MDYMEYVNVHGVHDPRLLDIMDFLPDAGGDTYAVWLEPDDQPSEYLAAAEWLVRKHSEFSFSPHVTLAALITGDEATVLRVAREVASTMSEFELSFDRLQAGPTYFQTVYIMAEPERVPELGELRRRMYASYRASGCAPSMPESPFLPHMSLAYQPVDSPKRLTIVDDMHADAQALLQGFRVQSVSVWRTDINDLTTQTWRRVGRFSLGGEHGSSERAALLSLEEASPA